jgi:hypothetical protein
MLRSVNLSPKIDAPQAAQQDATNPLEHRRSKKTLASLVAHAAPGLRVNEHLDHDDGALVFEHTCRLGLEGIVSKRRDSPYRSGRSRDWIKSKNPNAPAVKREAEEDWGKWSSGSARHSRPLRTTSGSRRRSSPFSSIRSKA